MSDEFLIIGITSPNVMENESEMITSYLSRNFVDYFHIRKPLWNEDELSGLIQSIPEKFHGKLKIHGHFGLVDKFNLGGVHLNSRWPVYQGKKISKSASIHSLQEIRNHNDVDYLFLSPIFDSISKKGYKSSFDLEKLENEIKGKNIVALGGVTPEHFKLLREKGFKGAAMLGCLWNDKN